MSKLVQAKKQNDTLPPALSTLRAAIEEVREIAVREFPNLDELPKSRAKALEVIRETIQWSRRLEVAVGNDGVDHGNGSLLGEFVTARTGGTPATRTARNLLGRPPEHLTEAPGTGSIADFIAFMYFERKTPPPDGTAESARYLDPVGHWDEVSQELTWACMDARARALRLCTWCDEAIDAFLGARWPAIEIGAKLPGKNGARQVTVTLAGVARTRRIAGALADLLLALAKGPAWFEHRSDLDRLLRELPELRGCLNKVNDKRPKRPEGIWKALKPSMQGRLWATTKRRKQR